MNLQDSRFTAETLDALGGPRWIAAYREEAFKRLSSVTPASTSGEDWRYGRIDELDLSTYERMRDERADNVALRDVAMLESSQAFLRSFGDIGVVVHVVDGILVSVDMPGGMRMPGVEVGQLGERADRPSALGSLLGEVDEPFAVLNDAFAPDATVIDIAASTVVDRPIVVITELTNAAIGAVSMSRLLLQIGVSAEASIVVFQTSVDGRLLHIPTVEMALDAGAHLRYDFVQHLSVDAWQLGYQLASVGRDASLHAFSASLGGDYARLYSRAALVGEGAESNVFAAYLGVDSQVQEFRTFQDHLVGRTNSELVFKGAVADHARSVYSGMIHMRKGARRAVASQTNRNLVLSEGAHADSVPNLDIEENDVRCSHASAVGPIDAEQRFYLESRGIPPEVAERLILLGFFDDLLAKANHPRSASYVRAIVEERLGASSYAALAS